MEKWYEVMEIPGDHGLNRYHPHIATDKFGNLWITYTEKGEILDEEMQEKLTKMRSKSKIHLVCWTNESWQIRYTEI